jgi:GNAT superfamily N-acetyltransferase
VSVETGVLIPPSWRQLAPLLSACREEGFFFLARLEHEYLSGQVRFDAPGETLLGAFEDSVIVGVGGLTRDPYCDDPRIGRVRHVYVLPEFRGRGVGKMILSDIERHAQPHFNALVLRTDTRAAEHFYQSIGYELLAPGGDATHRRVLAL